MQFAKSLRLKQRKKIVYLPQGDYRFLLESPVGRKLLRQHLLSAFSDGSVQVSAVRHYRSWAYLVKPSPFGKSRLSSLQRITRSALRADAWRRAQNALYWGMSANL